jgi:hypothetical protein
MIGEGEVFDPFQALHILERDCQNNLWDMLTIPSHHCLIIYAFISSIDSALSFTIHIQEWEEIEAFGPTLAEICTIQDQINQSDQYASESQPPIRGGKQDPSVRGNCGHSASR